MALIKYHDWLQQQQESSPQTRLRQDAALGLKPWQGSLHGKSTASPFQVSKLGCKKRKKKRKHA
jgi:hypothetical protein